MMKGPIISFTERYIDAGGVRMHMPGHKGISALGPEPMDITEIFGADSLYEASGIIAESEARSAALFKTKKTLYSAEGSSQCIRAMLGLVSLYSKEKQTKGCILASRNVHKAFVAAAGLLNLDVSFIPASEGSTLLYSKIDLSLLEKTIKKEKPTALYLTSPDYLGNIAPIEEIADICHRHGVLLAVDNAHGAYLAFLSPSRHPIALGADICCDSAHKTLPALTGGAYLHLCENLPPLFYERARDMMALFGSTSPSYLILLSLDRMTEILDGDFPEKLKAFLPLAKDFKDTLAAHGYTLMGDEALKVTVLPKDFGYTGDALADALRSEHIECEFSDADSLVLMLSPYMEKATLDFCARVLCSLPRLPIISERPPKVHIAPRSCSVRDAIFSKSEQISIENAKGRTLSSLAVSCPPAVPPVVCGEVLTEEAIEILRYYGIHECRVLI